MNRLYKKRVLICAHDRRLIGNLQSILTSQEVEYASSGGVCISMINEFQPELLLLQMFLSDMDAFDLLTKASERCTCTPKVVLFTSAHPGEAASQFASLHVAGTILKSESLESLRQQLQVYFNNALPPLTASGSAVVIASSTAKTEQYTRALEAHGFQVYPAETPETATGLVTQLVPVVVLFEIEACLGQIFPVLRTSRGLKQQAGLIAISQLEDNRLHQRMLESGVHCILEEPLADEDLHDAIHSVLSLRKPEGEKIEDPQPTILVVEDAPDAARALELLLREHGYGVTLVRSAEAAMSLLPTHKFNLLLLDLLLPGMGGVELLARVRHSGSRIPCVVVTGSHDVKDRRLLGDLGVQAIFDKPADYELVTNAIGELI